MKRYLGDGVYAQFDGYHLILTTEDGIRTTNTIYLDEYIWIALTGFREEAIAERKREIEKVREKEARKENG